MNALIATKINTANYTWTWCDGGTTKYNDTEVKGWKIVKNATSVTLFLPAAGLRGDAGLTSDGSSGDYWSSSLVTDPDRPYGASVLNLYFEAASIGGNFRCYGIPVRPVFAE